MPRTPKSPKPHAIRSGDTPGTQPGTQATVLASEIRYRRLFEAAQDGILILDAATGKIQDANPFIATLLGYAHAQFIGKELWEIGLFKDKTASKEAFHNLQRDGYIRYDDLPLETSNGKRIAVEFVSNVYAVGDAQVIQCNIRDITPRKHLEEGKRQSDRLARNLVESLPHRILVKDRDSRIVFCNANYATDMGSTVAEIIGKDLAALYGPTLAAAYVADDRDVMESGVTRDIQEPHLVAGEERWIHTLKVPYRDELGAVVGVLVVFEDITRHKQLEEQSRQSQKLEAVGRLAGGVAHDFNNLLTVILGYCDLAPPSVDMEQIRQCAERATNLTRQLLVFSRNQVLAPRILDLNLVVSAVDRMLQRVIGEHIDLRTKLATDLGSIEADAGQIELAVMNLVVNARDAMPNGGQLSIETANVDLDADYAGAHHGTLPGRYVMLAVTDSGAGMDAATKARMFEPFFTTKAQGKGTGLGLATVYGVVKQSHGHVWCYSEPDRGTTFKIYLPRTDAAPPVDAPASETAVQRGAETILVAEDDELVRTIVVRMLSLDGYTVIATNNGADALREMQARGGTVALVISDMVMPGMTGLALRKQLLAAHPGVKTLLMSGYTGEVALRDGDLESGTGFLQKPFTRDSLARKVRELLDRG